MGSGGRGRGKGRPAGRELEGVEVERVPPQPEGWAQQPVTRTNSYEELFALLVMASVGLAVLSTEVENPVLYAKGVEAIRKLREALEREAGADPKDGMPWSPFG